MSAANCPRCNERLRVPTGDIPEDAYAVCPWCQESFPVSEVLNSLPPLLTILSAEGTPVELATPIGAAGAVAADRPAPTWVAAAGAGDAEAAESQVGDSAPFTDDWIADQPPSPEPGPIVFAEEPAIEPVPAAATRRSRKQGGGLRTALGVVGGGLLALPIAGGIMWGLGIGPFAEPSGRRADVVAAKPLNRTPVAPAVDRSDRGEFAELAETEVAAKVPATIEPPSSELPPTDEPASDTSPVAVPAIDDQSATEPAAPPANDVKIVDLDPAAESPQLAVTARTATRMVKRLNGYDGDLDTRRRYMAIAYKTIAECGELASGGEPALRPLVDEIGRSTILDDLERESSLWLNLESRPHQGVLLIGASDGTSVTLDSGIEMTVTGRSLPASGSVFVLGRITGPSSVDAVAVDSIP